MTRKQHEDDLSFLRELVAAPAEGGAKVGLVLLLAGSLYGLQCLIGWAQANDWLTLRGALGLIVGLGPTAVFLLAVVVILLPTGNLMPRGGAAARAINGSFAAAGLANVALVAVFALNAFRASDPRIWELYPPVVFALQGAAWMVAFSVSQRTWHLIVTLGWLGGAITLGTQVGKVWYGLTAGICLLLLMALPGALLFAQARRRSAA